MECLVKQDIEGMGCCQPMGDVGVTLDIGAEIKQLVQANPIPSIGIGLAIAYLLYSLLKGK
jgi:hypothetical protein